MPPNENPMLARIEPESTQGELVYFHSIRSGMFPLFPLNMDINPKLSLITYWQRQVHKVWSAWCGVCLRRAGRDGFPLLDKNDIRNVILVNTGIVHAVGIADRAWIWGIFSCSVPHQQYRGPPRTNNENTITYAAPWLARRNGTGRVGLLTRLSPLAQSPVFSYPHAIKASISLPGAAGIAEAIKPVAKRESVKVLGVCCHHREPAMHSYRFLERYQPLIGGSNRDGLWRSLST